MSKRFLGISVAVGTNGVKRASGHKSNVHSAHRGLT